MFARYGAGGVVVNNGKVVIVAQSNHTWSLPKGGIDAGECAPRTAKREIYEETGITDLNYVKALGTYKRKTIQDPEMVKHIAMFLYTTNTTELTPIDSHNPAAKWVSIDEAAELLSYEEDKEFLLSIRNEVESV